ncbi:3-dehydro-L-gulonate 2-dehydrogenase [Gaoshiqia sp. Z1-71]|uniref:3-dehydro-L-gulonate 2-dehydrogenase n=1 Tax=Gaoshiqia hydrogeniformans TaxID=3290090 RepID=UPI003BF8AAE3
MSQPPTIRISASEMKDRFNQILLTHGFTMERALHCARIFTENSIDGIYSHGVNRFTRFIENIRDGYINPNAVPVKIAEAGNMEQWNGQLGPGPINAMLAAKRSMELAQTHGMGLVALANTNHWMRGGTYGWHCAKQGFVFIGWTNTIANLPAWGARGSRLGNNPLVIALPYGDEAIVLDMAMSQYSYGKLEVLAGKGEQLPFPGGFDKNGELTTDPAEILETGRALPIGFWKGSALSFMLDLLATILSAGLSTSEISRQDPVEYGVSQVYLTIDLKKLQNYPLIQQSLQQMTSSLLSSVTVDEKTEIRYPGQQVVKTRKENLEKGIPVHPEVWEKINNL